MSHTGTSRPVLRAVGLGLSAVTALVLATGCSSSKSNNASTGGTTSPVASTTGSTPSSAASVSPPSASASATKSFAAGSGKGSKFCNELGVIAAQSAKLGPTGSSPADIKKRFDELKSLKGPLLSSAPSSIKGDLTTLFSYIPQVDGILAKAGYDYSKLDATAMAGLEGSAPQFETAGNERRQLRHASVRHRHGHRRIGQRELRSRGHRLTVCRTRRWPFRG